MDEYMEEDSTPDVVDPEIEEAVRTILTAVGEDVEREGLRDTPRRVAAMYAELFSGLYQDAARFLQKALFTVDSSTMVVVKDIPFESVCEHHLISFYGTASVGYLPAKKKYSLEAIDNCVYIPGLDRQEYTVVGLSKIKRVIDVFAKRPQVQEKLTGQIADCIQENLGPQGTIVVMSAEHLCMTVRGVRAPGTRTVTSAVRGCFETNDENCKEEFFNLLRLQ